jgi:hypothetical protein
MMDVAVYAMRSGSAESERGSLRIAPKATEYESRPEMILERFFLVMGFFPLRPRRS